MAEVGRWAPESPGSFPSSLAGRGSSRVELWLIPLVLLSPTQGPACLCCVDWCGLGAGYLPFLGVLAVVLMTEKDSAWK